MLEKERNDLADLDKKWLGDENFYHDLKAYPLENFISDYEEWKKIIIKNIQLGEEVKNNSKKEKELQKARQKELPQGFHNFEAHLLAACSFFVNKNYESYKDNEIYAAYYQMTEELKGIQNYYYISQSHGTIQISEGAVKLSVDLKNWLIHNKIPGDLRETKSLTQETFLNFDRKVKGADTIYGFKFNFLRADLGDLFYHVFKKHEPFSGTLLNRSEIIVNKDASKKDHVLNAFKNLDEKIDCFTYDTFKKDGDEFFRYRYKGVRSKEFSNLEIVNIGEKILRNYPMKSRPSDGSDPTYWSVYTELDLLRFLIEFSKKVGFVPEESLKEVFNRIIPATNIYKTDYEKLQSHLDFKKTPGEKTEDIELDETLSKIGTDVFRKDEKSKDRMERLLNKIEEQLDQKLEKDNVTPIDNEDIYDFEFLKACLEQPLLGINSFLQESLVEEFADYSEENPQNYLIIHEYLEIRLKLLQSIYKGTIKAENIEERIEKKLGIKKYKVCNGYFEEIASKIDERSTKKGVDKLLVINYFLYRFIQ